MVIWDKSKDGPPRNRFEVAWRGDDGGVRVVQVAVALAPRTERATTRLAPHVVDEVPLSPTAGYRDNPRGEPERAERTVRAPRGRTRAIASMAILVALAVSCTNAVIQSPATSGYVCGVMGVSCGNGMCCGREQACGIPGTASEGMCRFSVEGMMGASRSGGMTRQWAPHASSATP